METDKVLFDLITEEAKRLYTLFKEDNSTNNYPVIVYDNAEQDYKYYSLDDEEGFLVTAHQIAKDQTYGVIEDRHFETLKQMERLYGEPLAIKTLTELLQKDLIFRYKEANFNIDKQVLINERDYFTNGYLSVSIPKDECKMPKLILKAAENRHYTPLQAVSGKE